MNGVHINPLGMMIVVNLSFDTEFHRELIHHTFLHKRVKNNFLSLKESAVDVATFQFL